MRDAYAHMLPRLQAETELMVVRATSAGSGMMTKAGRNGYMRDLERSARPGRETRVRTLDELARTGLNVVFSEAPARG